MKKIISRKTYTSQEINYEWMSKVNLTVCSNITVKKNICANY